ncbi:MAG: fumarate hydratase [Candidatus Bathyarchaeia archaeon]
MVDFGMLIEDTVLNLLRLAAVRLPEDVKAALRRAYELEGNPLGRLQLENILENIRLAEEENVPVCQDTGVISFYLRAGLGFRGLNSIEGALYRAARKATLEIPLRPNSVDFFTNKNPGDNTGRYLPYISWGLFNGDYLDITVLLRGGGSENACTLKMMDPSAGLEGVKEFVLDSVIKAGGKPCPPTIIGVGLGGGADIATSLAKRALLKPLDEENPNEDAAKLERDLYELINMTGIGPMGLGGNITTLAVRVEYAHRHPASYPVAVAFQCWAARRATARIYSDGRVEYLSHKI